MPLIFLIFKILENLLIMSFQIAQRTEDIQIIFYFLFLDIDLQFYQNLVMVQVFLTYLRNWVEPSRYHCIAMGCVLVCSLLVNNLGSVGYRQVQRTIIRRRLLSPSSRVCPSSSWWRSWTVCLSARWHARQMDRLSTVYSTICTLTLEWAV
jgi:hypothetical protein